MSTTEVRSNDTAGDACETSLTTTANCGQCGLSCGPYPHASAACRGGRCSLVLCQRLAGQSRVVLELPSASGRVELVVEAYPDRYEFFAVDPTDGSMRSFGTLPTTPLAARPAPSTAATTAVTGRAGRNR